ncbi:unnamed protein product [Alternaria sp. RS040]
MSDYQFQDFGAHARRESQDRIGYSGWDDQAYNVPPSRITIPNTFDYWHTRIQDPVVPNNYISPEAHVGWLNPVMPAPLGGFELSRNDAPFQDITSYLNTTVPEIGYTGSHTIGTGLYSHSTVGQTVGVRPASFIAQQSWPHHGTRKCAVKSCEFRYIAVQDGKNHVQAMHRDMYTCDQCMEMFTSAENLGWHASNLGHTAFICKQEDCEIGFTRLDTYLRHQRSHQKDARRFPCKYCKKYRGKNGFKRKDHLTQHVRNYHHIGEDDAHVNYDRRWCPKADCTKSKPAGIPAYSYEQRAFQSSKKWIDHMRTEHDESEFSCPQPGCDRTNGKGYFSNAALRSHLRKVHGTDGSFDMSIQNNLYPIRATYST